MYKIRIRVKKIDGKCPVLNETDEYLVDEDGQTLRIVKGDKLCLYALSSLIPFLPTLSRDLPSGFWMNKDLIYFTCPDPGKAFGGSATVIFELKREKVSK